MEEQMTTMMEAMMSMNKLMKELCEDFKIRRYNLTPYRPKMNGAIEAHNKNIKKIIQKMTVANKDWHEMLSFVLHDIELLCELLLGQPCLHWCMRCIFRKNDRSPPASRSCSPESYTAIKTWRLHEFSTKSGIEELFYLQGKWGLNYEGPFMVKKAFLDGTLILTNLDGEEFPSPMNSDVVKQYYT
ncbi:hypothetical protein HKD37_15G043319 [Glycine soja]